jgi:hypothetical protein
MRREANLGPVNERPARRGERNARDTTVSRLSRSTIRLRGVVGVCARPIAASTSPLRASAQRRPGGVQHSSQRRLLGAFVSRVSQ